MTLNPSEFERMRTRIRAGGAEQYHAANAARGKLFARDRIAHLVDQGSFVEDGLFANALADGLPADGVITGIATIDGRPVCLMANDSTVKAGLLGRPYRREDHPDHRAGLRRRRADGLPGRLGRRPDHRPGRPLPRPARRRAHLLQPGPRLRLDPAGLRAVRPVGRRRRVHPGVLRRGRHGRRQRLACTSAPTAWSRWSPARRPRWRRWAAPGSTVPSPASGTSSARPRPRRWTWCGATCPTCRPTGPGQPPAAGRRRAPATVDLAALVPANERQAVRHAPVRQRACSTSGSLLRDPGAVGPGADRRLRPAGRRGRRRGRQQLAAQGRRALRRLRRQGRPGSCSSATRSTCRCCSCPTCPASWSARAVEKQGIIRHGAKMITAVAEATVPKICVVVRKAYGAGLYAMAGPGFDPDATIALPTAKIAVMGAEAAVNAVYANKIAAIAGPGRAGRVRRRQARGVRARHRHRAAGQRAGRRRDRGAGRPARRTDPPVRRRPRQGPPLLPPPARRHPGLTD